MKRNWPLITNQLGIRLMFAITINFYIILFVAMLNEHSVEVLFNHFNEAYIEYVMYFAILPVIGYSIYYEVRETRRKKKNESNRNNRRKR